MMVDPTGGGWLGAMGVVSVPLHADSAPEVTTMQRTGRIQIFGRNQYMGPEWATEIADKPMDLTRMTQDAGGVQALRPPFSMCEEAASASSRRPAHASSRQIRALR